jgi:hypothetical protein
MSELRAFWTGPALTLSTRSRKRDADFAILCTETASQSTWVFLGILRNLVARIRHFLIDILRVQ